MVSILLVEFVRGLLILHLDVVFYRRQETSESITESSYGSLRKFLSYSRKVFYSAELERCWCLLLIPL
jgi:hypothetical protein